MPMGILSESKLKFVDIKIPVPYCNDYIYPDWERCVYSSNLAIHAMSYLYKNADLKLVQTLKDHTDAVVGLAWRQKSGEEAITATLTSWSAETTDQIWQQSSSGYFDYKLPASFTKCLEGSPPNSYEKPLQIFVKTLRGEWKAIWVVRSNTVVELKQKIFEIENMYPPILLCQFKQMDNTFTLADYNITRDSTISIVGRLVGSGNCCSARDRNCLPNWCAQHRNCIPNWCAQRRNCIPNWANFRIFHRHGHNIPDELELELELEQMSEYDASEPHTKSLEDYKREGNWVTLEYLKNITNRFSPNMEIGRGGQGVVYRAVSESGQQLAVKQIRNPKTPTARTQTTNRHFMKELEIYLDQTYSHDNIMEMVGFHIIGENFDMVYIIMPLMEKGDLFKLLHTTQPDQVLTFAQRLKIVLGIVRAIDFLHTRQKPLLFRDLKPHNVLVDSEYNGRLSDFGSAAFGSTNGTVLATEIKELGEVVGTKGYIDMYYVLNREDYKPMSDVYQVGMLLFELMHGENIRACTHGAGLLDYVKDRVLNEAIMDLKDPTLGQLSLEEQNAFEGIIQIARRCCELKEPHKRPTAGEVLAHLQMLQNKINPDEAGPSFTT